MIADFNDCFAGLKRLGGVDASEKNLPSAFVL